MVPIYATVSFLSYAFYWHAIYFEVIRDCYEAFAIASFFALLCHYIAPDLHNQKDYFRGLKPKPWFYIQLKEDLTEHRPLVKVAAIKLVIFLSFWQTIMISFLTSTGAIKASDKLQDPDVRIGIPALLLCVEMAIFSVFHLFAFPWQVYDIRRSAIVASESAPGFLPDPKTAYLGGPLGSRALLDAFNPWDLIKAIGRGFRWFAVGRRKREEDISYRAYKISRPIGDDAELPRAGGGNVMPSGPFTPGGSSKQGRYHQLQGDLGDDDRRLLSHQQAVPLSSSANVYPRPGMRLPDDREVAGDLGAQGLYDGPSHHMPTNHMRNHQHPPYPNGQQELGIVDPSAERDTAYHGASPYPSYPRTSLPHPTHNPSTRRSTASSYNSSSDPDDWSAWSGAHGPHNQSDVARLSGEHIDRARLSAEQEARSRRTSEEPGVQYLDPRDGSRERGPSPSEVWQGMQGHGVRHADRV
ncbi:MAG: hypothetical protein L6R37_003469 [Teloschistes peruensis]|nr:MAG: hypothetical protein L6R37_003469 [Teloschistes peruensis]